MDAAERGRWGRESHRGDIKDGMLQPKSSSIWRVESSLEAEHAILIDLDKPPPWTIDIEDDRQNEAE